MTERKLLGVQESFTFHDHSKVGTLQDHKEAGPGLSIVFFLPKNPADIVMYARNQPLKDSVIFSIRCLYYHGL